MKPVELKLGYNAEDADTSVYRELERRARYAGWKEKSRTTLKGAIREQVLVTLVREFPTLGVAVGSALGLHPNKAMRGTPGDLGLTEDSSGWAYIYQPGTYNTWALDDKFWGAFMLGYGLGQDKDFTGYQW